MAEIELTKNSKRNQKNFKFDRSSKTANHIQPAVEVNIGYEESARRKSKEFSEREARRLVEETGGKEVQFQNMDLDEQVTMHWSSRLMRQNQAS